MKAIQIAALSTVLMTVGCTAPYLATRTLQAEDRVVTVVDTPMVVGGKVERQRVVCPEPSPDALKTLAGSAMAEKANVAALSMAFQESAANIGLRTQSIQLLRDQLFSICQAYANGAINSDAYQMLLTRNQRNTVAIMAIEQITGVVRGPNVALSGSSTANQAKAVMELTAQINAAETEYKKMDAAAIASAEGIRTKESIDSLKKSLESARAALVSTAGSATTVAASSTQLDPTSLDKVTETVKYISDQVTRVSDGYYLCLDAYKKYGEAGIPASLKASCDAIFTDEKPQLVILPRALSAK